MTFTQSQDSNAGDTGRVRPASPRCNHRPPVSAREQCDRVEPLGIGLIRAHSLQVYPAGAYISYERSKGHCVPADDVARGDRGKIVRFTKASAGRLRDFIIRHEIVGREMFSGSFTIHRIVDGQEWREICKRFRTWCARNDVAIVWRVELQRRKVPHLHGIVYVPNAQWLARVTDAWLRATREHYDIAATRHAVQYKALSSDDTGWLIYTTLHNSTSKRAQAGWIGKQWGIWCRRLFTVKEPDLIEISGSNMIVLLRRMRKYCKCQGAKRLDYLVFGREIRRAISGRAFRQLLRGLVRS